MVDSYYQHGAVPGSVKQSYLDDMLDYYSNTNMQHMLVPQKYEDYSEIENVAARGAGKPHTWDMMDKTRYVEAPGAVGMGHMGPDYITMMNIMKGQSDPDFNVGFMSESYMKDKYPEWDEFYESRPGVGGYFRGRDQTMALNPYDMLDFNDPRVDRAFSQGAGKPRTLGDLEGTSLQIGEDTDPWNLNVLAHELGHYGTNYGYWNRGKGKFDMPNITSNINMTRYIPDPNVIGTPGHNEAYWVGRAHDDRGIGRDMNLTEEAASNIREWKNEARNYIDRANQPRSVANEPMPRGATRFGTPNFAPPGTVTRPTQRGNPNFNTGGLASLVI
tara:strand:- start:43 stop:1032 length:990 start_codon:yes stop_codon:yes gene_type:complete